VRRLRSFGNFWYDFIVGDDWRLAFAGAVALGACGLFSHLDITSWWLVPTIVVGTLTLTMIRMAPPAPKAAARATTPIVGPGTSLPWPDQGRSGPTTEANE
jgi:hypothetical protein